MKTVISREPKTNTIYRMTDKMKRTKMSEYQPVNFKFKNNKVFSEMYVRLNWIKDCEDYWYVGFEPVGKSRGACRFGATRIYKKGVPKWGTIELKKVSHSEAFGR